MYFAAPTALPLPASGFRAPEDDARVVALEHKLREASLQIEALKAQPLSPEKPAVTLYLGVLTTNTAEGKARRAGLREAYESMRSTINGTVVVRYFAAAEREPDFPEHYMRDHASCLCGVGHFFSRCDD